MMIDPNLLDRKTILFGGKGGVGKTTFAAATGLHAAEEGKKTLILSSDPAHRLSDIFEQKIGDQVTPIEGVENLYAFEIDAHRCLQELRERCEPWIKMILKEIGEGPQFLEKEVMRELFELIPPGLDELLGLKRLNDFLETGEYNLIVIDTAAGAHALRLLEAPEMMKDWTETTLRAMNKLVRKEAKGVPRKIVARHLRAFSALKKEMVSLNKEIEELRLRITNPTTTFVIITIPELMGIYVTTDMVESLKKIGTPSNFIIVNFLIPESVECGFCSSIRKEQMRRVQEIKDKFPRHEIVEMPLFPNRIIGKEALASFAKAMFEDKFDLKRVKIEEILALLRIAKLRVPSLPSLHHQTSRLEFPDDLRFILFGGKGGVGKTTCSTATGIRMAEKGKKVLVVSTDPQRSLSDSLGIKLREDEVTAVESVGNLYVLEIDSQRSFEDFKKVNEKAIMQIAEGATKLTKQDVRKFLSLSDFPGMDEVLALLRVAKLMAKGEYDQIILDTAPTGHTLRFLELPDMFSKWASFLMRVRAKTRHLQRHIKRGTKYEADLFLEELMDDAKRVKAAFTDPLTEFVPVTTLDELALSETEQFLGVLRSYKIPVKQIIINKLVSPRRCPYCITQYNLQKEMLSETRRKFSKLRLVGMPYLPHEVQGIDRLNDFADILFESEAG